MNSPVIYSQKLPNLLNCSICGSKPEVDKCGFTSNPTLRIFCPNCAHKGKLINSTMYVGEQFKAYIKWNTLNDK